MGRFADTQDYYQRANALFEAEKDTYGRAYSYCGLGNAARMRGDYATAMQLFARAEKLYARIGDTASFAYTVWAMATVHKMRGDYLRSAQTFTRARGLFRKTRDARGGIYCRLGTGELALLRGRHKTARTAFGHVWRGPSNLAITPKRATPGPGWPCSTTHPTGLRSKNPTVGAACTSLRRRRP